MDISNAEQNCRLCGALLSNRFSLKVLGKHNVQYYQCINCHSLQTENPYWLDEAYGENNLSNADTGAAQRNLHNLAACYTISKLLNAKNVIDIGGGDGLLCRMLRDHKINAYVKDKYAQPAYAQGFTDQDFDVPDLLTGFEVIEHYPNPTIDLGELFSYKPNALMLSTAIYEGENKDWWYLAPESGQHVFFYTKKAIKIIANRYNYTFVISGSFILFMKNASFFKRLMANLLLKGLIVRLLKALIFLLPTPGVWRDHLLQVEKSKQLNIKPKN
jgi:2-polyprenyl-3-methyl-5-hydroxy-6-metoxy-1,4-benzoquinol methylase